MSLRIDPLCFSGWGTHLVWVVVEQEDPRAMAFVFSSPLFDAVCVPEPHIE